ncbi:hypothetical protein Ancab_038577 [Ancistrocladus abbreviatus]
MRRLRGNVYTFRAKIVDRTGKLKMLMILVPLLPRMGVQNQGIMPILGRKTLTNPEKRRVLEKAGGLTTNSINFDNSQESDGPVNLDGCKILKTRPKAACCSNHGLVRRHSSGQSTQRSGGLSISSGSSVIRKIEYGKESKRRGNHLKFKSKQMGRIQPTVKLGVGTRQISYGGEFPSDLYGALNSCNNTGLAISYSSNDRHAPMTNSSYTSDHMAVATSYPSNNCAALANSCSGNHTAEMTSYLSNNCHVAMAVSSYFGNHMVVATSYPSNDTAVSTSYNSNDHHELSNSFYSSYDYHAGDSNVMAAAFFNQDINACTNLPSTGSGFTRGLLPLPPPQFFQSEQQLISTAHDSQMFGCNGDTDLMLHENLNDHATCNSLREFTVASSTLDHTNTLPIFQSVNDPQWMIPHNNYLDHAVEDVGSDCGVIVRTGTELGGGIPTRGMLPVENPMDALFLNYGESVNSTSPPGVCDGNLIMTPMQASGGGGGPGAYLPMDQFDVCSFNPIWEVVEGNGRSRTTHLG